MFKMIVWATDGSENAERALPYAEALAQEGGASLLAVHIVQEYVGFKVTGLPVRADEADIRVKLGNVVAGLSDKGLNATLKILTHMAGQPGDEIADIAKTVGADLIVVGTRGHTAIAELLLGSVTQRLLHIAPCPVLAVPPPPKDESERRDVQAASAVS